MASGRVDASKVNSKQVLGVSTKYSVTLPLPIPTPSAPGLGVPPAPAKFSVSQAFYMEKMRKSYLG